MAVAMGTFKSSLPWVGGNGPMMDERLVRSWLAAMVKTKDPIIEIVLVRPDDRVVWVHRRPNMPFTMSPAEMIGQRLQDLDLNFGIPICVNQARALNTAIPTSYEWRLDDHWIVRTLVAVPRRDRWCLLYVQHRGTYPATEGDPPTLFPRSV